MEQLITRELLSEVESKFIESHGIAALNEAASAHTRRKSISREVSLFLSHKHSEEDLVRQAVAFFRSLGVAVYVDWMDSRMPPVTSSATANRLKQKIRESDKFVLLASDSAIESKWCNWELGLGDAAKYSTDIAILPAGYRGKSWKGKEYLGIYPVITSQYQYLPGPYFVELDKSKIPLDEWLKK